MNSELLRIFMIMNCVEETLAVTQTSIPKRKGSVEAELGDGAAR